MGSRGFFLLTLVPAAVALGPSCAPIQVAGDGPGTMQGGLGGTFDATGSANQPTPGTGGALGGDAGLVPPGMAPLTYLCGGSQAQCSPDPSSEDCTPGGNAGFGGGVAADAAALTCQLVGMGNQVAAVCGMAGTTADGVPCKTTSDCAAGLGCVLVGGVSICRAYCCQSLESCAPTTYCSPVPLAESPKNDIPVCIPATSCTLLEDSTCQSGQTCAIVRADGTTSCVTPGVGTAGEACPCAAGYTCSWTDNLCLQLCATSQLGACGPNAFCQGGTLPYPTGVGYCVPYD